MDLEKEFQDRHDPSLTTMSGQLSLLGMLADGGSLAIWASSLPPHTSSSCYSGPPPSRLTCSGRAPGRAERTDRRGRPLSPAQASGLGHRAGQAGGCKGSSASTAGTRGGAGPTAPGFKDPGPLLVWEGSGPLGGEPCCPWPIGAGGPLTAQMRNSGSGQACPRVQGTQIHGHVQLKALAGAPPC